jgi:hypothetical protein
MPLCRYCDKPEVTSDGVYRIGQQFDLLKRSGLRIRNYAAIGTCFAFLTANDGDFGC